MEKIKRFRSKNEQVYDLLRDAILNNELAPGVRIVIDDVARQLGVSQIPIREAVRQLEADGLVTTQPFVGAMVAELRATVVVEIFSLLEGMEITSGRAMCALRTPENIAELEMLLHTMDSSLDDPETWSTYNHQLHQRICEIAQMPLIRQMLIKTMMHWDRLRRYYLNDVFASRVANAQAEHWEMLKAIQERDADLLENIVRKHNRAALQGYVEQLQAAGQFEKV
jgi:DNA-binding GntR family transcriptional regulator